LGSEIISQLLRYCFEFHREENIEISMRVQNKIARKLAKKCGFYVNHTIRSRDVGSMWLRFSFMKVNTLMPVSCSLTKYGTRTAQVGVTQLCRNRARSLVDRAKNRNIITERHNRRCHKSVTTVAGREW
jgi:hypothetical protein